MIGFRMMAMMMLTWLPHFMEGTIAASQASQGLSRIERNREKEYLRQQFARHFKLIQVTSQQLIREHEEGTMTSPRLSKSVRDINKSARTLRTMIGLGELANDEQLKTDLTTAAGFDEALRLLGRLTRDFARNPVHQNSRILNTDHATQAQTDLLSIINLSRLIGQQSGIYGRSQMP
jgi:hypothetical protein